MVFIAEVVVSEANRKHLHVDDADLPLKAFVEKNGRRCNESQAKVEFYRSENVEKLKIYAPMIECGETKVVNQLNV